MARSAYEIAMNDISIADVYLLSEFSDGLGFDLSFSASSPKLHCPFGHLHSDGGYEPAMRLYGETNTAHCFRCTKTWNPVSMYADMKDLQWKSAAEALLEVFGISKETTEERWNDLIAPRTVTVSTSDLAEALKLYCARICPQWDTIQFEPGISSVFGKCLDALSLIQTEDDVEIWRARTKEIMATVLTHSENSCMIDTPAQPTQELE